MRCYNRLPAGVCKLLTSTGIGRYIAGIVANFQGFPRPVELRIRADPTRWSDHDP